MEPINSAPLTSDFIYAPHFRTQCVSLNAQAAVVPRGTIVAVKSTADGTYDVIGAGTGAYSAVYGVLLNDAPISASAQPVELIVFGELFYDYVNSVYKAANSANLTAAICVALRNIGIILK